LSWDEICEQGEEFALCCRINFRVNFGLSKSGAQVVAVHALIWEMEQECIKGASMDWANQEVSAVSLKQDSSVALFLLVFGAGKYFLKVEGHGRDPHSVSPWICWRTWELRFIQLPEQASMLHSPITCHSPHSVMACLFLQHQSLPACHSPPLPVGILGVLSNLILDATGAFPTICCTLPSYCSHQIDSRVEIIRRSHQYRVKNYVQQTNHRPINLFPGRRLRLKIIVSNKMLSSCFSYKSLYLCLCLVFIF